MIIDDTFERRFHPDRRDFRIVAVMSVGNDDHDVTIVDISKSGMKLYTPVALEIGTPVTVFLMNESWPGIVHWTKNTFVGLHLLRPFDLTSALRTQPIEEDYDDLPEA